MRTRRPIAGALCAAMLGGFLIVAAAPAAALTGEESEFVSLHNSTRSSAGRRTLSVQADLVDVARRHSARMAAAGDIWHNPNLAREVKNWTVVGENVGMGPSVRELFDAFMDSPGHRSNILDTDYNQFGVGVVISEGTIYVTVVFAQRRTTTTVRKTTTTTTTTRTTTTRRTTTAAPPAAAATAPAAPKPAPARVPSRTVSMLVAIVGLDAS